MEQIPLDDVVQDLDEIEAALVTALPEAPLVGQWSRRSPAWSPEVVAAYFGDLVRANREALEQLGSASEDMSLTIESGDHLVLLRELDRRFVLTCLFPRRTPLGMARLDLRRLAERLPSVLPAPEAEELSQGARLVGFLRRYAPDPHAVLLRVALRTGIPIELLEDPDRLAEDQVAQVEVAAKKILGLDRLAT